MIFVALVEAADRGELILLDGGMCRYHRRRDGVVVIREILVLPERRKTGIGKELYRQVLLSAHGSVIQARCPAVYESNGFWRAIGFSLISIKDGINLWQRPAHG